MSKKKIKIILVLSGIILIIVSITGFVLMEYEKQKNIDNNKNTLEFIEKRLLTNKFGFKYEFSNNEMPVISYNSIDYVGIIEIPRLEVKLPIENEWDIKNIKKAPARFNGSVYNGSMIIGGTNSKGQFDFFANVDIKDELTITDAKGVKFQFNVSSVKHTKEITSENLINKEYDLILFAKNRQSNDYILIQCNMRTY